MINYSESQLITPLYLMCFLMFSVLSVRVMLYILNGEVLVDYAKIIHQVVDVVN